LIRCDPRFSAGWDAFESKQRRIQALSDKASTAEPELLAHECVAKNAAQLLGIKIMVNNDYKALYESNLRQLYLKFTERLNIFHRFLGVVMINVEDPKGLDGDKVRSEFERFHRIFSSPLGHDELIAEIQEIVATKNG
jgi:hypothetical protein